MIPYPIRYPIATFLLPFDENVACLRIMVKLENPDFTLES